MSDAITRYVTAASRLAASISMLKTISVAATEAVKILGQRKSLTAQGTALLIMSAVDEWQRRQVVSQVDLKTWPEQAAILAAVKEYRAAREAADAQWQSVQVESSSLKSPDEIEAQADGRKS